VYFYYFGIICLLFLQGGEHYICCECLKNLTKRSLVENKRYDIKCVFGLRREEMSKIGWGSKRYGGSGEEVKGIHLERCEYEYDTKDIKRVCNSGWSKILLETLEEGKEKEKEIKGLKEEKDKTIKWKEVEIEKQKEEIATKDKIIIEKEEKIRSKEKEIEEKERGITTKDETIKEKVEEIKKIKEKKEIENKEKNKENINLREEILSLKKENSNVKKESSNLKKENLNVKEENSSLKKGIEEKGKLENDLINSRKGFFFFFISYFFFFVSYFFFFFSYFLFVFFCGLVSL
jgi:hypothetical protein